MGLDPVISLQKTRAFAGLRHQEDASRGRSPCGSKTDTDAGDAVFHRTMLTPPGRTAERKRSPWHPDPIRRSVSAQRGVGIRMKLHSRVGAVPQIVEISEHGIGVPLGDEFGGGLETVCFDRLGPVPKQRPVHVAGDFRGAFQQPDYPADRILYPGAVRVARHPIAVNAGQRRKSWTCIPVRSRKRRGSRYRLSGSATAWTSGPSKPPLFAAAPSMTVLQSHRCRTE